MFRQAKRKPNKNKQFVNRVRRSNDEDDDDDEQDEGPIVTASSSSRQRRPGSAKKEDEEEDEESPLVIIRRRHNEKKPSGKNRLTKRKEPPSVKRGMDMAVNSSFQVAEEQGNGGDDLEWGSDDKKTKKRKKRRSKGLGFGGMTMVIDEDEDHTGIGNNNHPPEADVQPPDTKRFGDATPAYGKEALEALMAEQKIAKPKELDEPILPETTIQNPPAAVGTGMSSGSPELNFIPLHEVPEMTEHDNGNDYDYDRKETILMETEGGSSKPIILEDPDDDNWEEQVAKRAGIQTAPKASYQPPIATTNTPTLNILRQNLQDTVQHLTIREEDLGHAIMRREADLAQTQADRKRQQNSIEGAGKACGDYQKLRYELAMWVGALRDLDEKVTPIQKSLLDMISLQIETAHREWVHWQDDVCATLREFHRIDRVLGRAPSDLNAEETEAHLDEFGRDIGSQIRRDRDNRCRRRRKRQEEVAKNEDTYPMDPILDFLWAKEEASERRYDILQEALRVAMDDMNDTYASPNLLEECFAAWRRDYSDEYNQCYGNLSLADLAHVFEQVDLCRSPWIRGFLKTRQCLSTDGTLFPSRIATARDDQDPENVPTSSMERAYRKDFIPFVIELLREYPSVIFLSKRMSQLFSGSVSDIITRVGKESRSCKELCSGIANAGFSVLKSLSIPIMNSCGDNSGESALNNDHRVADAIRFVEREQPRWIQDLVLNMLELWIPVLQQTSQEQYEIMGKSVLGFLSETYLFYLASMPHSGQAATEHLAPIWKCLTEKYQGLLESPDFILQSAPLRAAAGAYGLPRLS